MKPIRRKTDLLAFLMATPESYVLWQQSIRGSSYSFIDPSNPNQSIPVHTSAFNALDNENKLKKRTNLWNRREHVLTNQPRTEEVQEAKKLVESILQESSGDETPQPNKPDGDFTTLLAAGIQIKSFEIDDNWSIVKTSKKGEPETWCIRNMFGTCLNKSGDEEEEPSPSNRDEAFLSRCRFSSAKEAFSLWTTRAAKSGTTI